MGIQVSITNTGLCTGQDNKQLAETCFRLGEAYAKAEDYDTALVVSYIW